MSESQSKGSKPNTHTVQFINIALVRGIEVLSEAPEQSTPGPLPNLSYSKVRHLLEIQKFILLLVFDGFQRMLCLWYLMIDYVIIISLYGAQAQHSLE